jgi:hypothetical protein
MASAFRRQSLSNRECAGRRFRVQRFTVARLAATLLAFVEAARAPTEQVLARTLGPTFGMAGARVDIELVENVIG